MKHEHNLTMDPCPYCKADCILGKIAFQGDDGGFVTHHQVQCSRSMTQCGYRAQGHWAENEAVALHNDLYKRANRPVRKYGLTARGKPSVLKRLHEAAGEDVE